MHKVFFSEKSIDNINSFSLQTKEYFKELYSNTGIYSEKEIVESYMKSYDTLQGQILDRIQEIAENGLPGRNPTSEASSHNTFFIRSYIVIFTATMDEEKKEVTIDSIRIGKSR